MPDASRYDIFIWGGSDTVAKGGRHLAEQNGELERIMNEFSREVSSERELFDQAVTEMEAQDGRSHKLLDEAECICSSRIQEAANAVQREVSKWEDVKERANSVLNAARNQKAQLLENIRSQEYKLDGQKGELKSAESLLDSHKTQLANARQAMKSAQEDLKKATYEDAASTAKSRIESERGNMNQANASIQDDHKAIQKIKEEIAATERILEQLRAMEGQFDAKITAAQNLFNQAKSGLDTAKKHETQLNSLRDKASANRKKAEESHHADNSQLSAICHDRKVSVKLLDALQGEALNRQKDTADTLDKECDVLQNVAERMALYEEFSF